MFLLTSCGFKLPSPGNHCSLERVIVSTGKAAKIHRAIC